MVYPIAEFLVFWLMRHAYRIMDQGSLWPNNYKDTKAKTLPAFIDLYSGPEFLIHYKHSFILNSIFVTMLFGPAMPILFPICLLTLCFLYVTEGLMLAYSYIKPPMYDVTINKDTIKMISWSPLIYAISSIWFFSNQQIFRNSVLPLGNFSLFPNSGNKFNLLFT